MPGGPVLHVLVNPAPATVPQKSLFSQNPTAEEISAVRVFEEPLIPMLGSPTSNENSALAQALTTFANRSVLDDFSALTDFISSSAYSWYPSLSFCLGWEYYHTGHYSKALDAWEDAWLWSKDETDPRAQALADRAIGELAKMYSRIGGFDELESIFDELGTRKLIGPGTELMNGARQAHWMMKNRPEVSFRCGPLALSSMFDVIGGSNSFKRLIFEAESTQKGVALSQVAALGQRVGLATQAGFRNSGAGIPLPCVVHWKVGHFAALLKKSGNLYLAVDPTFGQTSRWISQTAIDEESSGYFVVSGATLPTGWRAVPDTEAQSVFGKGVTANSDPGSTTPYDLKENPDCVTGSAGMAVYNIHLFLVSLNIEDTPLRFAPPRGPPVAFTVTYNQREANQPANFTYGNLGPQWTCNWLSYIKDNGPTITNDVDYYVAGGGTETFTFDQTNRVFKTQWRALSTLVRKDTNTYEMTFNDGSRRVFGQPDGTVGNTRKVFLTQVIDPTGYTNLVNYGSDLRISTVTDPVAGATNLTFFYNSSPLAGPTNTILQVTDRYGRSAYIGYRDMSASLSTITDSLNLTSQVFYATASTFINKLQTPYGATTFAYGEDGRTRWLEATDPYGDTSRTEFNESSTIGVPISDPGTTVPQGMYTRNFILNGRNTFFWDKKAHREAAGDYTKARLYHWLHSSDVNLATAVGVLESYKEPFENRVWFNYPGQSDDFTATSQGTASVPNLIGRVLDDGYSQIWELDRNSRGKVTVAIDPIGRTFWYWYDTNDIDLTAIWQAGSSPYFPDLVASFENNSQHLPTVITDAAGQVTRLAYNAYGQLTFITNALQQITSFTYDASGRLQRIDGPVAGTNDSISFTYDSYDRVQSVTDSDGYTITTTYDVFDRVTTNSFPDGSKEITTYNYLDPDSFTDRAGTFSKFTFNALRQLIAVQQATNWITRYQYCKCGDIKAITDPLGRITQWFHDVQGRVTAKQYMDGSRVEYTYEAATSRLKSVKNERGQVKTYLYEYDDDVIGITYSTNANTEAKYFFYDPYYNRLTDVYVGSDLWSFDYYPVGSLGGGRLKSVDGPVIDDTVVYSYDPLGRISGQALYNSQLGRFGYTNTVSYDALSRLTNAITGIGTFKYSYFSNALRLDTITFPNGQLSKYSYFDRSNDFRIKQITNNLGTNVLSAFIYQYDVMGRITYWKQIPAEGFSEGVPYYPAYDAVGQALEVDKYLPIVGQPEPAYVFGYDLGGNRISKGGTTGSAANYSYNPVNGLIAASANVSTRQYQWDADNHLRSISDGSTTTTVDYDAFGRVYRFSETVGGVTTTRRLTWAGAALIQERINVGSSATLKWYYSDGYEDQYSQTNLFFTRDHLGSIHEITSSNRLEYRYAYEPYGNRSTTFSTGAGLEPNLGFTGYYLKGSLLFAPFRAYDPDLGRWLSRDPLGEVGGLNLYRYAGGDPVNNIDTDGLCPQNGFAGAAGQFRDANTGIVRNGNGTRANDQFNPFNRGNLSSAKPGRAGPTRAEAAKGTAQTATQLEFPFARGASVQTPGVTAAGETFVRVGAGPQNLKFGSTTLSGAQPGTYAFPEATFNTIGQDAAALKNLGDLPGAPPQYYRILRPPAGTPIQRGIVPGGQFGGVGGAQEVIFPKGF